MSLPCLFAVETQLHMFVWIILTLLQHQTIKIEKYVKKLGILAQIFNTDKSNISIE